MVSIAKKIKPTINKLISDIKMLKIEYDYQIRALFSMNKPIRVYQDV